MRSIHQSFTLAVALAATTFTYGGCAAAGAEHRPIVDGGDPQKYEADLVACHDLARRRGYVNGDLARNAAAGAALGAMVDGGEGALAGAAIGGGVAALQTARKRKAIVINCMQGRGHKVVEPA